MKTVNSNISDIKHILQKFKKIILDKRHME